MSHGMQAASVCEWLLAVVLIGYFASFHYDFVRIRFELHIVSVDAPSTTTSARTSIATEQTYAMSRTGTVQEGHVPTQAWMANIVDL